MKGQKTIRKVFKDRDGYVRVGWFVGSVIAGICAVGFFPVYGIAAYSQHLDHQKCDKFATISNREVKFVSYNHWDWECLVRSTNGRWISIDNVNKNEVEVSQ